MAWYMYVRVLHVHIHYVSLYMHHIYRYEECLEADAEDYPGRITDRSVSWFPELVDKSECIHKYMCIHRLV